MIINAEIWYQFWSNVEKTTGCWLWIGREDAAGYGRFSVHGCEMRAHRLAYHLIIGKISDGLTLDHLCRTKLCINPQHLEPVPRGVNAMRGFGPAAMNSRKDVCQRGHPFTEGNVIARVAPHRKLGRRCRTCKRFDDRMDYRAQVIMKASGLEARV